MQHHNIRPVVAEQDSVGLLDVLGPKIRHLTDVSDDGAGYCLMMGEIAPGVIVPLHSHADRETFYVLSGTLDVFVENGWIPVAAGKSLDLSGGQRHAWRNVSAAPAMILIATTPRMGRFLREVGRPVSEVEPGKPAPADVQRFLERAAAYGYWVGSPADNAIAGLRLG
ncbi:cupin domain-containing protein [Bosea caraganae]|uniref:Cupin domain-containing protein n=2 Tax=Bosea caraganae TaxID=2763117 RepID=A0A370L9E3_9HYPH|nr:cupin domain-containing protein [Bosea caraganae]RDJ27945.1 cupin domain-containing protein [Bosea caraganae]